MIMLTPESRIAFLTYMSWPRRISLLCFCCFLEGSLYGQSRHLKGSVIGQSFKEKIAFSSISWKRSGKGVQTDSTGHFSIPMVYEQDTLSISHVGYNSLSILIDWKKDTGEAIIELSPKPAKDLFCLGTYNKRLYRVKTKFRHKHT